MNSRDAEYARRYRDRRRGTPPREPQPCGTRAAAARHRRNGELPCAACTEAERAYQRSQQQKRR